MNPSVFIAIPSGTDWKADFGMSLAGMMAQMNRPLKGGRQIERLEMSNLKGSILSRSRQMLAERAIEKECSHLLFIDSDMTFPAFTLHQLLSHDKAVVAANCVTKGTTCHPTARVFDPETPAGKAIQSVDNTGLQKVWRVGTGIMLIKTSVFADLGDSWFDITWNPVLGDYIGEDWNFCAKLESAGIPIWVDHDLSKHIGHIGAYTYTHSDSQLETNT